MKGLLLQQQVQASIPFKVRNKQMLRPFLFVVSQLELPEEQEEDSGEGTNEEHDDDISAPPPPPPPPPSHPTLNPRSNPKYEKYLMCTLQFINNRVSFKSTTNHYSDPELVRLDNQLDIWCTDLKRNVLVRGRDH